MTTFPAIRPTELTLNLGEFGVRQGTWRGVWETPELTGSLESEQTLTLRYENITTAIGRDFLVSYRASGSGLFSLDLPIEVVAGVVNADMRGYILDPFGLKWFWDEPPSHLAVKAGRCTLEAKLIAELR